MTKEQQKELDELAKNLHESLSAIGKDTDAMFARAIDDVKRRRDFGPTVTHSTDIQKCEDELKWLYRNRCATFKRAN